MQQLLGAMYTCHVVLSYSWNMHACDIVSVRIVIRFLTQLKYMWSLLLYTFREIPNESAWMPNSAGMPKGSAGMPNDSAGMPKGSAGMPKDSTCDETMKGTAETEKIPGLR